LPVDVLLAGFSAHAQPFDQTQDRLKGSPRTEGGAPRLASHGFPLRRVKKLTKHYTSRLRKNSLRLQKLSRISTCETALHHHAGCSKWPSSDATASKAEKAEVEVKVKRGFEFAQP